MNVQTHQDLFIYQIRHLYNIESQVILTLPGLAESASSPELKRLLGEQEQQCIKQKQVLRGIFARHKSEAEGELCETMKRLIDCWKEYVGMTADPRLRDMILIGHCNRISHNKISAYGYATALANCVGAVRDAGCLAEMFEAESTAARRMLRNADKVHAADYRTFADHA